MVFEHFANARLAAITVAAVLSAAAAPAGATLLTNGTLDDPPDHETDVATGWSLVEGPSGANAATFASFANHTPAGERGLWLRSFEGGLGVDDPVTAHLLQTVPATPGLLYALTAWSRWETNYPGGVPNLNQDGTDGTDPFDGPVSPTQTLLALEFLGGSGELLASSVLDLRSEQSNDGMWREHAFSGVAPAGTTSVRVRASMIDGVLNPGVNPQSAFFDDFELNAVPEPGTLALLLAGVAGLAAGGRRRSD